MIQATVAGNLGKDAVLRQAGSDNVCSFSIASSRKIKDKEVTTWVSCSMWGKRGEALVRHLTKGKKVVVVGELSTREHDGKTYLEVRVSELEFMGGAAGATSGASANGGAQSSAAAPAPAQDAGPEDNIPF